ncbi:MAG TPA: imidazole glycerol phosphate synthase subunit HisF [Thermoanaerobaculaceae bacterium]|nr:imidazole glycerol phosphate synthase subunit HisF [Thermoanaerobaculaceae bacterium]HRS17082.1 imidazole glycerol phosphate synthase subunit HisF [Thermoanaerobaculaceae bacterium]
MPAFRVIPCLDVDAGRVVKGVNFVNLRDMGEPAELARRYRDEGGDELVFLDISATVEGRAALRGVVERVAEVLDIPFTVGGGVASVEDAGELLLAGADKVAVNSAAVADPTLLTRLAERFGSQCVVLAIDARRRDGGWEVVTHGGRRATGLDAVAWAREGAARGAGEILLTSMDRDGTGLGFDCELLAAVRAAVELPLVASGGGETSEHFAAAARAGADAGLAATIFHEARVSIAALKQELAQRGLLVRQVAPPSLDGGPAASEPSGGSGAEPRPPVAASAEGEPTPGPEGVRALFARGLLPAVVQDADTGRVLMLGYMNEEAFAATLETGQVHFFSRSRQRLWRKGETSGHTLALVGIALDCDGDALLVQARPAGSTCHTGEASCFYRAVAGPLPPSGLSLAPLFAVLAERFAQRPEGSYSARLFAQPDKALKKLAEEAAEVILAAKNGDHANLVWEVADVLYHLAVIMVAHGVSPEEVSAELARRAGGRR